MLHNLKGIVLRSTKYTDNSLIVNIYTREFGLQSYLVRGVHSRTSKVKSNYFRGLMLLDFIATKTESSRLERINEITGAFSFASKFDPAKSAIAFFLNEVLSKTIREEESNPGLFNFLVNVLELLSLKESNCANFHLTFLLKYTQYLGFYPTANYTAENKYFDLSEGRFIRMEPKHLHFLNEKQSCFFHYLMNTKFEICEQVKMTNPERKLMLSSLLDYYRLHNALVTEMTSQLVLEQF
jgi:DNA repair protein RecO (recombination protein O)